MSFTKEEQEAAIEEEKRIREEKKRLKAEGIIESTMALLPFSVQTFRANNLVGLRLSGRKIMQLWESGERKPLKKLRFLHLNLKILELKECQDLEKVPAGCLERRLTVDLRGCPWSASFSFSKQLESLSLLVKVRRVDDFPWETRDNLPMLAFTFQYFKQLCVPTRLISEVVFLDLPCTKLESVSGSISSLQHLRDLMFFGCIPELPNDLDLLKCLEQLTLRDTPIKCLPDSMCMLKHLKSLKLEDCQYLEELPEDIGQLERLEKLILINCESVGDIPSSICNMKCLRNFQIPCCIQVEKFPEEFGNLKLIKLLNIMNT